MSIVNADPKLLLMQVPVPVLQVVSGIQHHKSASCSNSESGCNSASNMSNPKAAVEAAASESVAAEPVMMLHTFVCQGCSPFMVQCRLQIV